MTTNELYKRYKDYYKKFKGYRILFSILEYDNSTIAPIKSLDEKSEYTNFIFEDYMKLKKSNDYINLINELDSKKDRLNPQFKRIAYLAKKELDQEEKVPLSKQVELNKLTAKAFLTWNEAKAKNDYNIFAPSLEKIINLVKEITLLRGETDGNIYNTLLDDYEEGITTTELDSFFNALKSKIIPLLKRIKESNVVINDSFAHAKVSKAKQLKFSKYILKLNGYDYTRGALGEAEHPFTSEISPNDIRVTTHIYENLFFSNIFSTAHEGGHAIYNQNLGKNLICNLKESASMAMDESQSRFYENIIARSPEYIDLISKKVNSLLPKEYKNKVTNKEMYLAANKVEASLIRTEADELTYTLHIIIRYELEKGLFCGTLEVKDLKKEWNRLYKEYLGVDVTNDSEGILQDIHWSCGSFGYFPSYALGNAYGAQILHTMKQEINVGQAIKDNKIKQVIGSYLKKNLYQYGKLYSPKELIIKLTGEPLNPQYFIDYLTNKYEEIYFNK